ncbi:MAG: elongation factor 1-beta [Nanoarchaeota archaeon]
MATVAIKLKIMPEDLDTDLDSIKKSGTKKIKEQGGVITSFEEEPIAFGLKALIATMAWPEEKDTDLIENIFSKIKGVSSVEILDYRRAIG